MASRIDSRVRSVTAGGELDSQRCRRHATPSRDAETRATQRMQRPTTASTASKQSSRDELTLDYAFVTSRTVSSRSAWPSYVDAMADSALPLLLRQAHDSSHIASFARRAGPFRPARRLQFPASTWSSTNETRRRVARSRPAATSVTVASPQRRLRPAATVASPQQRSRPAATIASPL